MVFPLTWIGAPGVEAVQHPPPLSPQVAQVWLQGIPPLEELLPSLSLLSPEERNKAEHLRLPADQRRFLAGRLFLRRLLSRYSGLPPESIGIEQGPKGKPYWRDPPQPIQFNLSHSHEQILVALALNQRVGVDLEWIRPVRHWQAIAQRYFSPTEQADLAHCPEDERDALFFQLWTRKEALLKATGTGWAGAKTLAMKDSVLTSQGIGAAWSILPLEIGVGYAAAVAVEKMGAQLPRVLLHRDKRS